MSTVIDSFETPEHRFLSNFYPATIQHEGLVYPTVENAYQAAKCLDPKERLPFLRCGPGTAKRLGRAVYCRPDWERVKLRTMAILLRIKFLSRPLRQQLLDTGDAELIEGNTWGDTYWGVYQGNGFNHLGQLLMMERSWCFAVVEGERIRFEEAQAAKQRTEGDDW